MSGKVAEGEGGGIEGRRKTGMSGGTRGKGRGRKIACSG